jgi:mono/diheme cytochrome c family protein
MPQALRRRDDGGGQGHEDRHAQGIRVDHCCLYERRRSSRTAAPANCVHIGLAPRTRTREGNGSWPGKPESYAGCEPPQPILPHTIARWPVLRGLNGRPQERAAVDCARRHGIKRLPQQWCASCHQVEPNAPAKDVAPPFASLGVEKTKHPGWVRGWLTNPHPPMQGINLSRQQIDDIVSYLQSLSRVP